VVGGVDGLHPAIAGLDRELARHALGRVQLIPVSLTIRATFFEEECRVAKRLMAVGAHEALGMPLLVNCVQAVPCDGATALGATWSHVLFEADLAIFGTFLLDESDFEQLATTVIVGADKVVRTPGQSNGQYERAANFAMAIFAHGHSWDFV